MQLYTINNYIENVIVIEKSRFICELFFVTDEKTAKEKLEEVREKHPKAVHHCYAYIIKSEYQNIENQSDDGEPSKTAGMPMLDILRYEKLVNVLAVVTRYFGGTLLGTGGLIRAYSSSVKKAVDLASIKEVKLMIEYRLDVSYSLHSMVEHELKKYGALIKKIDYDEKVIIYCYTESEDIINLLIEKTNNAINFAVLGRIYM